MLPRAGRLGCALRQRGHRSPDAARTKCTAPFLVLLSPTHFATSDADDLVLGGESIGGAVVDVQVSQTVASRGDDVRFPWLVDDTITSTPLRW